VVRRTTVQAIAVMVGVFLLGGLAGSAATYALMPRTPAAFMGPRHFGGRMRGLERRLNLTTEQSRQVQAVFDAHAEKMEQHKRAMFEGCGQPMRDEIDAIDREIRGLLNPAQQQAFDSLIEERKQRGLRGPFGPPSHGGGHGPAGRGRGRHGGPPPPPPE
jgi:Spy/CpxP family protein refolding chaperone